MVRPRHPKAPTVLGLGHTAAGSFLPRIVHRLSTSKLNSRRPPTPVTVGLRWAVLLGASLPSTPSDLHPGAEFDRIVSVQALPSRPTPLVLSSPPPLRIAYPDFPQRDLSAVTVATSDLQVRDAVQRLRADLVLPGVPPIVSVTVCCTSAPHQSLMALATQGAQIVLDLDAVGAAARAIVSREDEALDPVAAAEAHFAMLTSLSALLMEPRILKTVRNPDVLAVLDKDWGLYVVNCFCLQDAVRVLGLPDLGVPETGCKHNRVDQGGGKDGGGGAEEAAPAATTDVTAGATSTAQLFQAAAMEDEEDEEEEEGEEGDGAGAGAGTGAGAGAESMEDGLEVDYGSDSDDGGEMAFPSMPAQPPASTAVTAVVQQARFVLWSSGVVRSFLGLTGRPMEAVAAADKPVYEEAAAEIACRGQLTTLGLWRAGDTGGKEQHDNHPPWYLKCIHCHGHGHFHRDCPRIQAVLHSG